MYKNYLFCDKRESDFQSEKQFQNHIYNYLKNFEKIKDIKKENRLSPDIRLDITFNYNNKNYIIECKILKQAYSHKQISSLLDQLIRYKDRISTECIYLIAISADVEQVCKLYGDKLFFPISQTFAYFGFYFIVWNKDKPFYYPNDYYKTEKNILTFSNGNGYTNLIE